MEAYYGCSGHGRSGQYDGQAISRYDDAGCQEERQLFASITCAHIILVSSSDYGGQRCQYVEYYNEEWPPRPM